MALLPCQVSTTAACDFFLIDLYASSVLMRAKIVLPPSKVCMRSVPKEAPNLRRWIVALGIVPAKSKDKQASKFDDATMPHDSWLKRGGLVDLKTISQNFASDRTPLLIPA